MRDYIMRFLKLLEENIPPPERCHHVITFAQFGSDETGWNDRLALQVNDQGKFYCFFLDDEDFTLDPEHLVLGVMANLVKAKDDPATQFGVQLGQFLPSHGQ